MPTSRARAFVEILARKLDPNPDELPKFSHIPHSDADSVLSPAASSSISILEGDPGKGVHFTPTPSNVSPGNFLGLGKGTVDSPIHFTPTPSNESTADFPVSFTPSLSPGHTRIEIDIKTAREMAWQFGEMNIPYNLRDAIYTYRASTCRAGDISLAALWKRVSISSDNTLLIWYDRMEFSRKVEEEVNRLQRKGDVLTRKTAQELRELLDCKVSDWALVLRQARWYGAFWLDLVGLSEPYLDCPGVGICALGSCYTTSAYERISKAGKLTFIICLKGQINSRIYDDFKLQCATQLFSIVVVERNMLSGQIPLEVAKKL